MEYKAIILCKSYAFSSFNASAENTWGKQDYLNFSGAMHLSEYISRKKSLKILKN